MKAELVVELYTQVGLISNTSVREFVQDMLNFARPSFCERPAARHHHFLDERGESGNLLHTIRVVKIVSAIATACAVTKDIKDIQLASAILHDVCRYGLDGKSEYTHVKHQSLVRALAERHNLSCDYYELIMRIIENHMGRWGDPPFTPKIGLDEVLHLADCVESHLPEVMQC